MEDRWNPKALISRIDRCALHDGPGIRTLVVMKGCPLRCRWCSSPYTQSAHPEILYHRKLCEKCGRCIEACTRKAIVPVEGQSRVRTDRRLCSGCGDCAGACPNRARELSGRWVTVEELLREVEKDTAYYRRSGGGVTVGGGEPMMQAKFVAAFLAACRSRSIHCAMETSAFAPWEKLAPVVEALDLVYMDLKHSDDGRHIQWTGVSNCRIAENIRGAARLKDLILRVPVVPGFNGSVEEISDIAAFAATLGERFLRLELLPYHKYGIHHYAELERAYALDATETFSDAHMSELRLAAESSGIAVRISS